MRFRARPYSGTRQRGGFTLIELLAVIGIIAILAALLLPALAKAQASARRIECMSRMKQWALAFQVYVDENGGFIPREGLHASGKVILNNWAHVQDAAARDVWYNALSKSPASIYARPADRPAFYDRNSFFHCPSAAPPKRLDFPVAFFSIAMNSQLINPPSSTISFSRLTLPSQTPIFLDNLLDEENPVDDAQAKDNLGQPAADAHRFAGLRHGRSGNLAFADGSAKSVAGIKVVETQGPNRGWAIVPPVDIFWDPD